MMRLISFLMITFLLSSCGASKGGLSYSPDAPPVLDSTLVRVDLDLEVED